MLRVIVVDDEQLARQAMRQLLAEHKSVDLVGEASSPQAAAELIRRERPDAVFLDIEMHSGTGFDLLQEISSPPLIVFVTAHSQFAAKAYDVAAIDYLLKPVQPKRLSATLARLAKAKRTERRDTLDPIVRLKMGDRTMLLRADSILALCANKDYTTVLPEKAPAILASQPLGALEALLPSPPFVRLDRSLVINMDRLREIETVDRSQTRIWFHGGAEGLLLGRTAADRLRRLQRPNKAAIS
jgi:two-component system LytT family response regulator